MKTFTLEEIRDVFKKAIKEVKKLGEALNRLKDNRKLKNPQSRFHK